MNMNTWPGVFRLASFALGLALMAGCDGNSTSSSSDGSGSGSGSGTTKVSLSGSWAGTIQQGANPPAAISMSITQTGDLLGGTYNGTGGTSGTMTGSVSGSTVNMTTTVGAVVSQWTGTLNDARTSMSGTFNIVAGGGGSGTWSLNQ